MHQLLCFSLLVLVSCELFAADSQVALESDAINCEQSIEQASVVANEDQAMNPKIGAAVALATGGTGTILAILGGVGTGLTCPQAAAYEAAQVICGISITGLVLGGICVVAAVGTAVVVLVRDNPTESEN